MNLLFKNFIDLTNEEHINILEIRNSNYVRNNMKTTNIIKFDAHLNWVDKLQNDKLNVYYAVINDDVILGAIYITEINYDKKECTWGLYFKEKNNPFISSISTYLLIDKVFDFFNLEKLKLEVNKKNKSAYRFDLSFGFEIYDEKKEENDEYYLMFMSKNMWKANNESNLNLILKKKIDRINYKFK